MIERNGMLRDTARQLGKAIEDTPIQPDGGKTVDVRGDLDPKTIAKLRLMGVTVTVHNRKKRRGIAADRRRASKHEPSPSPARVFVDAEQELRRRERNQRKSQNRKRGRQ